MIREFLAHFSALKALKAIHLTASDKRCPVCREVHSEISPLCHRCAANIILRPKNICNNCGLEINSPDAGERNCISCQSSPPYYSRLYFYGIYEGLLRDMILDWKFYDNFGNSSVFQYFIKKQCERLSENSIPDLIIPVPLHLSRLRMRGFNQSSILAQSAAETTKIKYCDKALIRARKTQPQTRLSGNKRKENLLEAFVADTQSVKNKKILLIDDVFTTGSTADECARTLYEAGASKVEVMTIARALL